MCNDSALCCLTYSSIRLCKKWKSIFGSIYIKFQLIMKLLLHFSRSDQIILKKCSSKFLEALLCQHRKCLDEEKKCPVPLPSCPQSISFISKRERCNLPRFGEVGPVPHHMFTKLNFFRLITLGWIEGFAENVIDFIRVQHSRPRGP